MSFLTFTGIRKITNYLPFNLNVLLIKDDYPSLVKAFDEKNLILKVLKYKKI